MSPVRLCSDPRCPNPAVYRGRCRDHARQHDSGTQRAGRNIYNAKRWQLTREKYLLEHPFCACGCGRLAEDVHHKRDLADGGDPWSFENLTGLSHACHSRETRRRQQGVATSS